MRVLALGLLLLATPVSATADGAPPLKARVVRVAAWKNGLAAVTREVSMPGRPGTYAIEMPSPPLHGTLGLALPPKARVTEIVAEPQDAMRDSMPGAACAAVGRMVTVERGGDQPPVTGRLVSAPCGQLTAPPDPRWQWQQAQGLLRLADGDAIVALPLSAATALRVQGGGDAAQATATPRAAITFESVAGDTFEVTWMTRGLAWAPSARIDLASPTAGTLSASAVIVNDAEDLADVAVDLVSGPARFSMGNVPSPLARPGLIAFLQALSGRSPDDGLSGYFTQNMAGGSIGGPGSGAAGIDGSGSDMSAEDASLRRIDAVTLRHGASSYRPLWSEQVVLEHVYRWDVTSTREPERSRPNQGAPKGPQHVLRLRNASANPWTSQPLEILSDGVLVGQSRLDYTPTGAFSDVTIADALDLMTEDAEVETKRAPDETDRYHQRAWLTGTLSVENLTGHDVTLEVTKEIEGDLLQSDPPAQATKLGKGLQPKNPRQRLAWRLPVKAGAKLVLTYSYSTWI